MPVAWSDGIDEILGGDLTAGVCYLTPAKGVVIAPMCPLGIRDRELGTVTVTTSLGLWKKVARLRANPAIAISYHAREHGLSDRPVLVLVQGRAEIPAEPDRAWLESITPQVERFLGPRAGGLTGRWLDVYYWNRVPIIVTVERVVAWPAIDGSGSPVVTGSELPGAPPPQSPPKNGTGPRVDAAKAAKRAGALPHALVGWCGADGLPVAVPVKVGQAEAAGIALGSTPGLLPPGGRRAGLTAHSFKPLMHGQHQRVHTGWLEVSADGEAVYAPHTASGYALPASKLALTFGAGIGTRLGIRKARQAGVAS